MASAAMSATRSDRSTVARAHTATTVTVSTSTASTPSTEATVVRARWRWGFAGGGTGAGAGVPGGPPLFASARGEARARRPTDIALAITSLLALVVTCVLATIGADLDEELGDLLTSLPPFFDPFWKALAWIPVAWALALLVAAIAR